MSYMTVSNDHPMTFDLLTPHTHTKRERERADLSLGVSPDNTSRVCIQCYAIRPADVITDQHVSVTAVHVSTFQPWPASTAVSPYHVPVNQPGVRVIGKPLASVRLLRSAAHTAG